MGFSTSLNSLTLTIRPWQGQERDLPMHAYVINLARSLDRRAHITAELKNTGLDYKLITAVDGRELDLHDSTLIDSSAARQKFVPCRHGRVRLEPSTRLPENSRRRAGGSIGTGGRCHIAC